VLRGTVRRTDPGMTGNTPIATQPTVDERPSEGQAERPADPARDVLAVATAPARAVGELLLALPYVVAQVPPLVQDARVLVGELTRLARGTDPGALNDVVKELSRLAGRDGELAAALGETAELARSRRGAA
jgi:hypothetical protein